VRNPHFDVDWRAKLACEIRIFLYSNLNLVVCAQTSARRWTQLLRRTL
jgi:hypothetical protein